MRVKIMNKFRDPLRTKLSAILSNSVPFAASQDTLHVYSGSKYYSITIREISQDEAMLISEWNQSSIQKGEPVYEQTAMEAIDAVDNSK